MDSIAEAVADALREAIGADAFDILPDEAGAYVDIAADEWTLRIEGTPATVAWLSIEDEPDQPDRLPAARRAAMPPEVDKALAEADHRVEGALIVALRASGDPLTLDLVAGMARDS